MVSGDNEGRKPGDVSLGEHTLVSSVQEQQSGNMTNSLNITTCSTRDMEQNCLAEPGRDPHQTPQLDDISLDETIFCRHVDAGRYLEQLDCLNCNETEEHTKSPEHPNEEVEMPKVKGSYVLGKVHGVGCAFTLDTGCNQTIISKQVYYRIPKGKRPKLHGQGLISQAGNNAPSIEVIGRGVFDLQLGPLKIPHRLLVVADISDQVLLGENLLREDKSLGLGDILYSENILRLGGKQIPLCMVNTPEHALHIVSVDDEIIPAMSEKLVDGFIERPDSDILGEDSMLVETNVAFRDRFGCLLTPVVVNTAGQVSTCVRVFNPFPQPVLIPGEVIMGELEPVEVLRVIKEKENVTR